MGISSNSIVHFTDSKQALKSSLSNYLSHETFIC